MHGQADSGSRTIRGCCAGFTIRSPVRFETLRAGDSLPPLTVDQVAEAEPEGEMLREWRPRPDNPFHGRLLRTSTGFAFWSSDAGWYLVDPERSSIAVSTVSPGRDALRRELRMFGIPVSLCIHAAGDVAVHASAVEIDGRAVLLAGPGRQGKTTLAAAFHRAGHRLLSEDTTRCDPRLPAAYPGPAAMRLRADVAAGITLTDATARASSDDRVQVIVAPDRRGSGAPVPLVAILVLRPGTTAPRAEPVARHSVARDLFALTFTPPGPAGQAEVFERIADLAGRVDAFDLYRPMTFGALDEAVQRVERVVAGLR
jgi:hypothetical protein